VIFRRAVFDRDVLALDEACFLEALAERSCEVCCVDTPECAALRDFKRAYDRNGSINGCIGLFASGPLRLDHPTLLLRIGTSRLCHVWTAPDWQGLSSRRRLGRCSHVFGLFVRFT